MSGHRFCNRRHPVKSMSGHRFCNRRHPPGAFFCLLLLSSLAVVVVMGFSPPPPVSPATGLKNELYDWKEGQKIRYQVSGPEDGEPIVLVHGLFVNSDHWRKTLGEFGGDDSNYRVYALDLWGCGYSSKPPRFSKEAQAVNGESRFFDNNNNGATTSANNNNDIMVVDGVMKNIQLGTASGEERDRSSDIDLLHPVKSPYNFYTWSEQITDFCNEVVLKSSLSGSGGSGGITLVSNSIGTISSLQALLDEPDLYKGLFVVSPNFRELHSAEVGLPRLSMPVIRKVQGLLREKGQPLFDALAKPGTVKQILMEPYKVQNAVDDVLVDVLLTPLLTPGASDVVFDTLSYSAGPLPEQQLSQLPPDKPVWVCYGKDDPWTPPGRVEALNKFSDSVEYIEGFDGVGHCPHDEAPELVHPLLRKFLQRVNNGNDDTISNEKDNKNAVPSPEKPLFFADAKGE